MREQRAVENDTYVCLSEQVRITFEAEPDRSVQLDFRGSGDGLTLNFTEKAFAELTSAVGRANAELLGTTPPN
ncbi:hypothetical protein [Saccharopolyspora gloriosae]|uniref:hypothetical protein n=1 Tax=Saccharopolyspora gloriosae TaxID=455344 RepID=UPI001FB5A72D|nr:hypothetical protein [Saccharopolyspora gloriosae]